VSSEFLIFYLELPDARGWLETNAVGQTMLNLNTSILAELPILLPPLPEQRKIAAILSTWDEAIALTQRLIAALQQRKQALMQLLLTGEMRFKEFEEEWEETTLAQISKKLESGGTPSTQNEEYWNGEIPWITGADFGELKIFQIRRYITNEGVSNSSTKVAKEGDILLVSRTGVGKIALAPFDVAISQDITRIVPKTDVVGTVYLLHYLAFSISALARFNQGTSINGVTRDDLKSHKIELPRVDEQSKLAQVLDLSNEQIEVLQKLNNHQQVQKRGLMQQLLTGAVRVSVEE
jgi:type I restriction enzyme S subunit